MSVEHQSESNCEKTTNVDTISDYSHFASQLAMLQGESALSHITPQ